MSRRPDGKLTAEVFPGEKAQDECGVFGVWAPGEEVAKLTFYGLYALQHRGQESAGIATSDGSRIFVYKDMGLVSQVFTENDLATLTGHLAIGHCRYSTTGSSTWANAQPTLRATNYGTLALAHNGNLTNTGDLAERVFKTTGETHTHLHATTDTEIMTALISLEKSGSVEANALAVLPTLQGAFSLIFMDENTLYAARDRHGIRPLVLGKKRLEGFIGRWEEKTLSDLLKYEQPTKYLVNTTQHLESGLVPVLTAGKSFLLGYTNDTHGVYDSTPTILFDDFTTAQKYVDFPFKVKSSACKMLTLINPKHSLRFLSELMSNIEFLPYDHKRYWISEYSKIRVMIPNGDEQNAIAQVVSDFDFQIETLTTELEKYEWLKQGMMNDLLTGKVRLV